jgi:uncharacterized protein
MSNNLQHDLRDPVHDFVRFSDEERRIINSGPFQRLRHIHQLALTFLVYPAATHRRFEHSLGVMEVATRIFDVVTRRENLSDAVRRRLPEVDDIEQRQYWRRVLRIAALCHDLGHLPFSHAAEHELLPQSWDHERLTLEFLKGQDLGPVLDQLKPPVKMQDISKIAVGAKHGLHLSEWERIVSEMLTGDSFGADRIDYLLRDSYHVGVVCGRFDHLRLIESLRILPSAADDSTDSLALGVEQTGLHAVVALLLARFFMYSEVYFHPVRRIYDIHLRDFLKAVLPGGFFPTDVGELLKLTDNEFLAQLHRAAVSDAEPGHDPARRIVRRDHFRVLYERQPEDAKIQREPGAAILLEAQKEFGGSAIRRDSYSQRKDPEDFPVLWRDGGLVSARVASEALAKIPRLSVDLLFVAPELHSKAKKWLEENKQKILSKEVSYE